MFVLLGLLIALAAPASAPSTRGTSSIQFTNRDPRSSVKEQARRFGWRLETLRKPADEQDYDLAKEAFDVVVPDSYKDEPGWGLLVWISPMQRGSPPKAWIDVL